MNFHSELDSFIIPANLKRGDLFFDTNVGNITISSVEQRSYAGTTRSVVHALTSENAYYWDKATGVLVEGNSWFPEYTMNVIVDKTNIWQPQLLGLDPHGFLRARDGHNSAYCSCTDVFACQKKEVSIRQQLLSTQWWFMGSVWK